MDKALKQRLVGATVLIILTVIILPMLLSGRSDSLKQESSQIEIPNKPEELSISKRRFPVGVPDRPTAAIDESEPNADSALQGEDMPDDAGEDEIIPPLDAEPDALVQVEDDLGPFPANSSEATQASISDNNETPVEPATEMADASLPENAPSVTSVVIPPNPDDIDLTVVEDNEGSKVPRYLVQVASFSSQKRADLLAAELRAAGMKVEVDVVERTAGRLHRVRVGPYAGRAEADSAINNIKTTYKNLSPRVVDLRPTDSAPVSTPSDPLVRWVVQVGSFSSAESADAQVAKLRLAGLAAFAEQVTSSKGSVYKVRVGPEVNRDKATELAKKIKTEQKLDGFVTTQE